MMKRLFALILLAAALTGQTNAPAGLTYRPLHNASFPVDANTLEQYRLSENVAAQRQHAWDLWAALNATDENGIATWETWYRADEIFRSRPQACLDTPEENQRVFSRQFETLVQLSSASADSVGESNLTSVMYNRSGCQHIIENGYHLRSTLDALLANQGEITPFPNNTIIMKAFWIPVKGHQLSPLPVWDDDPQEFPLNSVPNGLPTWNRIVLIDATGERAGETVKRYTLPDGSRTYDNVKVVGIDQFHNFKMDAGTITYLNQTIDQSESMQMIFHPDGRPYPLTPTTFFLGRPPQAGDYAALAALHVTTKEIPDWVWATFWWHDEAQMAPYGHDRPTSIAAPFDNYLMDVAYDTTTPREPDGAPNAVYNPYMELGTPNGIASNCMSCHALAAYRHENASVQSLIFSSSQNMPEITASLAAGEIPASLVDQIAANGFEVADDSHVYTQDNGWTIENSFGVNFAIEWSENDEALNVRSAPFPPVPVGSLPASTAYYDESVRSDFLWSLVVRAFDDTP